MSTSTEADAAAVTLTTGGKYGSDGAEAFTTSTVQLANAGDTWNEQIYLPTSAGLHPVVSISSGTQQLAAGYAPYARRLASYGIIAVVGDDLGFLTPTPSVVSAVTYVVTTYVPTSLAGHADMTRVGLAGHSRGGKASLIAAEQGLKGKVVAWFGLDPVDVDYLGNPSAIPGIATIGIPLGFAGASVSSNCSPAYANYAVYFQACSPPAVAITIEGAGHFQFEDASKVVGPGLCTPAGTADSTTVLADAVHYMTAFFARELLGDATVGASFAGAGAQADITAGRIKVQTK
jgi:predicted dienelactone hydrolase